MMQTKEKITAYLAKWVVENVAARINARAVVSLSREISSLYDKKDSNQ